MVGNDSEMDMLGQRYVYKYEARVDYLFMSNNVIFEVLAERPSYVNFYPPHLWPSAALSELNYGGILACSYPVYKSGQTC